MASTYTTIQGDTWDNIAYKQLGDESYVSELLEMNFDSRMYTVFPSGVVLTLPEVTVKTDEALNLPPWKR